jgi:hypothetical protein
VEKILVKTMNKTRLSEIIVGEQKAPNSQRNSNNSDQSPNSHRSKPSDHAREGTKGETSSFVDSSSVEGSEEEKQQLPLQNLNDHQDE